jgi:hypothetical protein
MFNWKGNGRRLIEALTWKHPEKPQISIFCVSQFRNNLGLDAGRRNFERGAMIFNYKHIFINNKATCFGYKRIAIIRPGLQDAKMGVLHL